MTLVEKVQKGAMNLQSSQRRGQALMNSLHGINPDLYKQISYTEADCFYDDKKIPNFLAKLSEIELTME